MRSIQKSQSVEMFHSALRIDLRYLVSAFQPAVYASQAKSLASKTADEWENTKKN